MKLFAKPGRGPHDAALFISFRVAVTLLAMADPFNLDALPRQCPYCHERVVMNRREQTDPNGTTTTTVDPQHDDPVCGEWKATLKSSAMQMHLLFGAPAPAVTGWRRWLLRDKPVMLAWLASSASLFLAIVPNWGGPYDVTVAVLTATLLAVIWYTFYTYQSVAATAEQARLSAALKRNQLTSMVATVRYHLQRLPLEASNQHEQVEGAAVWEETDVGLIVQLATEYGTVAAHHATRVAPALRWLRDHVQGAKSVSGPPSEKKDAFWSLFPSEEWTDEMARANAHITDLWKAVTGPG